MDWFADGRDGSGSAADTTTVEVYDSASCQQYSLALSIATAAAALSVEPAELTRKKGRRRKLAPLWRKLARCVGFARDRPPGARPHLALVRTAADVDADAAAAASGGGGLGAGAAGAAAAAACSSQVAVESARGQPDAAAAAGELLADAAKPTPPKNRRGSRTGGVLDLGDGSPVKKVAQTDDDYDFYGGAVAALRAAPSAARTMARRPARLRAARRLARDGCDARR